MPPETFAPAPQRPIPWEDPGTPVAKALFETIGLFLSSPREAYRRMPTTPEVARPILYYVILGWVAILVGQIYDFALRSVLPMQSLFGDQMSELGFGGGGAFTAIVVVVIAPILLVVALFVVSGIIHLFLMMVGGANSGFLTTCRVVCYAGTTQVFGLVPVCGGLISAVWGIVLEIIGLAEAHRTTMGKAALAVLLPLVLCCTCIGIAFALAGATILSFLRGAQ
jgi:hypothetical protein